MAAPSQPTLHAAGKVSEEADSLGLERLVFFSDAVFAIAITLLALEIRLPEIEGGLVTDRALLDSLLSLGSSYLAYIVSFLVIGRFWMSHHRRFRYIERFDTRLLMLNLILLMLVAFMPFPTSVISQYNSPVSTIFYAALLVLQDLMFSVIWWYATRHHRLVNHSMDTAFIRSEQLRGLVTPAVFTISIVIALFDNQLARLSWLALIPLSIWLR